MTHRPIELLALDLLANIGSLGEIVPLLCAVRREAHVNLHKPHTTPWPARAWGCEARFDVQEEDIIIERNMELLRGAP